MLIRPVIKGEQVHHSSLVIPALQLSWPDGLLVKYQ